MAATIALRAPATWPFDSPTVPGRNMPTGTAYSPGINGEVAAHPSDVGALLGFGFYLPPRVRIVEDTTDVIELGDDGGAVVYAAASAVGVVVPNLPTGFSCSLIQIGANAFTVVGADGVTVTNRQSQLSSAGDGAMCSLLVYADNSVIFGGDTA